MDALILIRARARRIAIVAGTALLMASGSATSSPHRQYDVDARIDVPASSKSTDGRYDMSAKLADAPLICLADLIFRDGFEGLE